jgi:hypothetical protein
MLAFFDGLRTVLLAPRVVILAYAVTVLIVLPMALVVAGALARALPGTTLADLDTRVAPIDDWNAVAQQSTGLAATFTPAILGIGAPLDNLDRILDGQLPAAAAGAAILVYTAAWVLLWGGTLTSLARGWGGWRQFVRDCLRSSGSLALLTLGALAAHALLVIAVRPILFAAARGLLGGGGEPTVAERVAAYAVFAAVIAAVSVVVDLARIAVVLEQGGVADAVRGAWRLIRDSSAAIVALTALNALPHAAAIVGYTAFEAYVRGTPRLWSAVIAGQAYVLARIAARLVTAAAQVRFIQRTQGAGA